MGLGTYLSLTGNRREVGWALTRGWAHINFFCLKDGCLFEVGANLRLGAYSNKYGKHLPTTHFSLKEGAKQKYQVEKSIT